MVSDANTVWPLIWIVRQVDILCCMARAGKMGGGGPPMFRRRKNSWSWHLSRHAFSFLDRDVFAHVTKQYLVRLLATMLATLCNFLPPRSKICTHCALSMPLDWCMSFSNLLPWWVVVVLVVLSGVVIFCYCYCRFVYAVAAACEYGSLIMVDVTSW